MYNVFLSSDDIALFESGDKFESIECNYSIEEDRRQRKIEQERERLLKYNIRMKIEAVTEKNKTENRELF